MNYDAKINSLKSSVEKAKTARTQADVEKKNLEEREEEIIAEIRALDVDPDKADDVLAELTKNIEEGIKDAEALIPEEFRG